MSRGRLAAAVLWRLAAMPVVVGGLLLLPAGTWRWWQAWAFLAVFFVPSLAITLYLLAREPELIVRRLRRREPERQQQIGQSVLGALLVLGLVVAGLDHRYGWSAVPAPLVLAADAVILGGYLLIFRVFQENRFAGSTVEAEAGQQVISSGPYAVVRHPMYLGALFIFLAMPFALGSYWTLPIFLLFPLGLGLRIRTEEAVLRRELSGYAEYAQKVRWRLLPGVW